MAQRGKPEIGEAADAERTSRIGSDSPAASASTDAVDEALKTRAMDEAPVGITIADATAPDMPLVYVNAAFERVTGYSPEYAIGRNCRFLQGDDTREAPVAEMRAAIEAGRATSVEIRNYRKDGEMFWNEVTIAPLRDEDGTVVNYVGFQRDITRRKRAERAAKRRASRIERELTVQEHLLERLDGVVADVTEAVTRADSRRDLEEQVAEIVGKTYAGAWIGTYDPATDTVVPEVVAGETDCDVRDCQFSTRSAEPSDESTADRTADGSREHEAGEQSKDSASATAAAVRETLDDRYVHIEPIDDGIEDPLSAVAAVPLHYGDVMYGMIGVYARKDGEFDSHERAVLTALGRTVATGINALESQRTLQSEERIEVRLAIGDHPLVGFASALGCRLQYAGSVGDRREPTMLFETEISVDEDAVRTAADGAIEIHTVLAGEAGSVLELSITGSTLRTLLSDYGGELRNIQVEDGIAQVTVEVGRETMAQSLADAATNAFERVELTGYRRREQRNETHREFVADLKARLTDRQHAALVRAYSSGYFEWPHEKSGEEIAETMGVSRSTFHQHLRAAQRKLVGAILERDGS
ncbi:PAS domain-containing protein [Halobellus marinus]|uniref:PAS domain-containing protein n=1 Tax=Halobellus TaxID=1073986 RepID=UPI0028AB192F|nr:PAS domain-containing protein [Halobellus sp. DFY28]